MPMFRKIARSNEGASAAEFALAAPVLFAFIVGIAQLGTLFFANSGLKAAVAEGARYATIYPRPKDEDIKKLITSRQFGLDSKYLSVPTVVSSKVNGRTVLDISMTYSAPIDFIFFTTPAVNFVETRRVYVHAS